MRANFAEVGSSPPSPSPARFAPGSGVLALAFLTLLSLDAQADPRPDFGPATAPTLRGDALTLPTNAAGLGRIQGAQGRLLWEGSFDDSDAGRFQAAGFALAAGTGRGFGFGFASQWSDSDLRARHMQLGASLGEERLSLGIARYWKVFREADYLDWRSESESESGARRGGSTQLALQMRPSRVFGLSLILDNLERNRLLDQRMDRLWTISATARTRREALGVDLWYRAPTRALDEGTAGATLQVRPSRVIRTWLAVEADTLFTGGFRASDDLRVLAGLQGFFGPSSLESWIRAGGRARVGFSAGVDTLPAARPIGEGRNVILVVRLDESVRESPPRGLFASDAPLFADRLHRLAEACESPEIRAVLLVLDGWRPGGGQAAELANAMETMRSECGLPAAAWVRATDIRGLSVAAAAQRVFVSPAFSLENSGLAVDRLYFGGLLDRLGVEAQVAAIGDWKTAPEVLSRTGPSTAESEQLARWLDQAWTEVHEPLVRRRSLDEAALREVLRRSPLTPGEAVSAGLADAMHSEFELREALSEWLGGTILLNEAIERERIQALSWHQAPAIAVLHIDGLISDVDTRLLGGGPVTPELVRDAIREMQMDPHVVGVVIRVSSGGGSAAASDTIRQLLRRISPELPVAVSVGDIAASGGYYVAALRPETRIHGTPATLTGSIGIYTVSADVDQLLRRFGVERFREMRGGSSSLYSGRGWTSDERDGIERVLEYAYLRFLEAVAEGRGLSVDEVRSSAGGRIWSGLDAHERGLIDSLGGLPAALHDVHARSSAASRAIGEMRLVHYPRRSAGLARNAASLLLSGSEASTQPPAGDLEESALLRQMLRHFPTGVLEVLVAALTLHGGEGVAPLAHLPGWYPEGAASHPSRSPALVESAGR